MNNFFEPVGKVWALLTTPHSSIKEVGERRRAQLLSTLSLILLVSFTWAVLSTPRTQAVFIIFLGITLSSYILSRTRFFGISAYFFSFAFTSLAFFTIANGSANSIDTSIGSIVPISLILASAILTQRGFLFLTIATLAATASIRSFADPKYLADPLFSYGRTIGIVFSMNVLLLGIYAFRAAVERARLKELQEANRELELLTAGLEQRVAERTKALATVAEIGTATSTILDPDKLLQQVVDLSKERFNFYHSHIYLLNQAGDTLLLTTGAGEPGRKMVAEGRSISIDRESIVARAARERKGVIVNDVTQSPDFLPNPLLPNTRSELAVPMIMGNEVIGVFDVQSDMPGRFTDADIDVQTTLASQVASSVQNARQYHESLQFKLGIENSGDAVFATDVNGTITYVNAAFEKIYGYSRNEVVGKNPRIIKSGLLTQENYKQFWMGLLSKNPVSGEIVNKHKDGHFVNIAGTNSAIVNDAGEIIGFLAVHHDITEQKRNQDLITQRARQQEAINEITQKIQATATIEDAMQIAAREVGHALGKRQILVALEPSMLTSNGKNNK